MPSIQIAPSILSADFANLERDIRVIESEADILHIDVMDGVYVPNLTFGPPVIKAIKQYSKLFFEAHLMISNPEESVDQYIQAGCQRIIFHPETVSHLDRLLNKVKDAGVEVGLAINPGQDLSLLSLRYIGELLDVITVMSVNPGFPAQKFIPSTLDKIQDLSQLLEQLELDVPIEIDGGVNLQTAPDIKAAGASILVAGNAVYGSGDPVENIKSLRKC